VRLLCLGGTAMSANDPMVKIASIDVLIHFADGAVQQFEFHGGEHSKVTLDISSAKPNKVEAEITVMGSGRLVTMHAREADK